MKAEDAEEFTASLGQIVAGSWRQIQWADRLGVPKALGLTTREWVDQHLGGYVRLGIEERREAARELVAEGMTQREAADVLGVDHATVLRDLRSGADAPVEQPDQGKLGESGADAPPLTPAQEKRALAKRVAALPDDLADKVRAEAMTIDDAEASARRSAERVRVWSEKISTALRTLARMANYPIPEGLILSNDELKVLRRILDALEGDDYGFLG